VTEEDDGNGGWVGLTEAIEALRTALAAAWWDGQGSRVRFRVEPVELTMQVGVTKTGKGTAGIKWHVLALGGERSKESASTQTLKLRLAPVLFDEQGNVLAEAEQLVSDRDGQAAGGTADAPAHEPE
jgi:hypothetical protein